MRRSRGFVGFAIVALYAAGAMRMALDGGGTDAAGFSLGLVAALVAVALGIWVQARRSKTAPDTDELD